MCGKSKAIIDNCKIKIRLGGVGGSISINETGNKKDTKFYGEGYYRYSGDIDISRDDMRKELLKFGADNLVEMLLSFVDNGAER